MSGKSAWVGATVLAAGVFAAGGVAVAGTDGTPSVGSVLGAVTGDDDAPLVGDALTKAVAAATAHVGEGKVTDTESDGNGAYEVEILKSDGEQVEVNLDSAFNVVGSEVDDDSADAGTDD